MIQVVQIILILSRLLILSKLFILQILLVIQIGKKPAMKKGSGKKERISITLDKDLVENINKQCEKRLMKVSNYVEKLIKIGLKNEK